jgi:hypothetical protein
VRAYETLPEPLVSARTSAFASCGHAVAYAVASFVPSATLCAAAYDVHGNGLQ